MSLGTFTPNMQNKEKSPQQTDKHRQSGAKLGSRGYMVMTSACSSDWTALPALCAGRGTWGGGCGSQAQELAGSQCFILGPGWGWVCLFTCNYLSNSAIRICAPFHHTLDKFQFVKMFPKLHPGVNLTFLEWRIMDQVCFFIQCCISYDCSINTGEFALVTGNMITVSIIF